MANTYTQIHIHAIFGVQNRLSLIKDEWKDELYKYITGIIKENSHRPLIINGTKDHVHLLFGFRPAQSLSALMQDIKGGSSKWINQKNLVFGRFTWQEGYGAFSYSKSQLPGVIKYIENQHKHHKKLSFKEEYRKILEKFEADFEEKYIFSDIE
jgi:REP element-mobilizing transposase RayT